MIFWSITFPNLLELTEIIKINFNSTEINFIVINLNNFSFVFCKFWNKSFEKQFFKFFFKFSIAGYAIPGIVVSVAIITFFLC